MGCHQIVFEFHGHSVQPNLCQDMDMTCCAVDLRIAAAKCIVIRRRGSLAPLPFGKGKAATDSKAGQADQYVRSAGANQAERRWGRRGR